MPTYSDDGQWWWDGRAWQPVTAQPGQQYAPQQQPHPAHQAGQQHPVPQSAAPQSPAPQQPAPQQPYPAQQPGQPAYGQLPYAGPLPPQQQPPQQHPPSYPGQQPPTPQYGGGQWQPQQTPPRKSRRSMLIIGIVLLAIGIPGCVIVGWHYATTNGDSTASGKTKPPVGKNLEPGQPVTAQSLAEVNPNVFYESVLKRQMTQPLGELKSAVFADQAKFTSRDFWSIHRVAIDHKSGKFAHEQSILRGTADQEPTNIKCQNGTEINWSNSQKTWGKTQFSSSSCSRKPQGGSDGVVSSGLTPDQADKVLAKFRDYKGYVNPQQPTLLQANGKAYVRQVVDLKPTTVADDNYYGSAIAMWAFRDAGLDPVTWPWSNPFNLTEGTHIVYYLDTATLLPAAAFMHGLDTPAGNGEAAVKRDTVHVVNYSYPKTLPAPVFGKGPGTLTLTLPEGWKMQ